MHEREAVEKSPTPRERSTRRHEKGSRRRPTGDATDEQAPLAAPGSGRRLGGNKQEGGGIAEPPKKPAPEQSGKNTGVQQSGTKSDPATQITGRAWLGGKQRAPKKAIKETQSKTEGGNKIRAKKQGAGKGYLGGKIAGQGKTWRSGRRVTKRERTRREKE